MKTLFMYFFFGAANIVPAAQLLKPQKYYLKMVGVFSFRF